MGSGFKQLIVWQRALELAVKLKHLTGDKRFIDDLDLRRQIRRAAVSIFSNIAEGMERDTDADGARMLYIAKGSAAEIESQLIYASRVGYLQVEEADLLNQELIEIRSMLSSLIKKLRAEQSAKKPS
jgi:four helix bundle protein